MTTAISIGWTDLIGKWRSIFLRYSNWSLTGQFGITESTHKNLRKTIMFMFIVRSSSLVLMYGASFSKAPETFWARKTVLVSQYNRDVYTTKNSCVKGTSTHIPCLRWDTRPDINVLHLSLFLTSYSCCCSPLPVFKPWGARYESVNYGISNYWSP